MKGILDPGLRRRELAAYFVLTYLISWAIEIPLVLSVRGQLPFRIPMGVHYLASLGPILAAIIVALFGEGWTGVKRVFSGLGKWRVGRGYLLFSIVFPIVLFFLAVIFERIISGAWPDLRLLGTVDYLGEIGILLAVVLWLLTFGLFEEAGWRGFALPRLQATRTAFSASIILGVFWMLWHLPAFFYRDTFQSMGIGIVFPMISVLAASIVFTWLYNGTGGSLLMVVIFHGLFDLLSVSSAGGASAAIVMSALVVFWAVRAYNLYGRDNLSPVEKSIL